MSMLQGWPRSTALFIDTNILVLYIVGLLDPGLVAKHKRTRQFLPEDFQILDSLLRRFDRLLTTPNVLTEVSNLVDQIGGETAAKLQQVLGGLVTGAVQILQEEYVPSSKAVKAEEFRRLGLADSSILFLTQQDLLVLTDDTPLYLALQRRGIDVVNFHHVRAGWG